MLSTNNGKTTTINKPAVKCGVKYNAQYTETVGNIVALLEHGVSQEFVQSIIHHLENKLTVAQIGSITDTYFIMQKDISEIVGGTR